jgi:hypothetical protein
MKKWMPYFFKMIWKFHKTFNIADTNDKLEKTSADLSTTQKTVSDLNEELKSIQFWAESSKSLEIIFTIYFTETNDNLAKKAAQTDLDKTKKDVLQLSTALDGNWIYLIFLLRKLIKKNSFQKKQKQQHWMTPLHNWIRHWMVVIIWLSLIIIF